MYSARRGTSTSRSFSYAVTGAHSQNSDEMYSSGSTWLIVWW